MQRRSHQRHGSVADNSPIDLSSAADADDAIVVGFGLSRRRRAGPREKCDPGRPPVVATL